MFTTSRLRFRARKSSDQDHLLALYNDPRVVTWITERSIVPRSEEALENALSFARDAVMFCIIEEIASGAFVGFTVILPEYNPKDRDAGFGLALLPEFWGKGYGFEIGRFMVDYAFRHMGSHRVSLTVFEGNDRAISLYKKIGFVEEARIRKLIWIDGGWHDSILMGILQEEWTANQNLTTKA